MVELVRPCAVRSSTRCALPQSRSASSRAILDGPVDSAIDETVAVELLATLREALSNVSRHAAATLVDVEVVVGRDVTLRVADDGTGPPAAPTPTGKGLVNMAAPAGWADRSCSTGASRREHSSNGGCRDAERRCRPGSDCDDGFVNDRITVFLLDDHEIVRRGLRDLLEAEGDIAVVGEASTEAEAVRRVPALDPDVAVLDVRLQDGDGVSACCEIRSSHPPRRA